MSGFGEYLKLLLERNQETVTSLSRKSGVERTSIHKAINGERILSYKALKKIEKSLCLTNQEILILREYHDVELQGEDLFELCQMMMQMLNSLTGDIHVENKKAFTAEKKSEDDEILADTGMRYLHGETEIILVIRQMIEREIERDHPEMQIYMPCDDSSLQHYFRLFFTQYETNLRINHLCPYYLGENRGSILNAREGISQLKYALDRAVLSRGKYNCFISYQKEKESAAFPWYIITSQEVMMITDDSEREACFIRQKDMVRSYKQIFYQKKQGTNPYIRVKRADENIENVILDKKEEQNSLYVITAQAGIARYMPVKILEDRQLAWERVSKDSYAGFYFSRSGIRRFMKDGILDTLPKEFQAPISVIEREEILTALAKDIGGNRLSGRLIKGCKYRIARGLHIYIAQDEPVRIILEKGGCACFVQIDEIYSRKAFWDFADYLARSEEVESKEDTLAFLQDCIKELREQEN